MVQFLSIFFFLSWIQFLLGFSKSSRFLCHPVFYPFLNSPILSVQPILRRFCMHPNNMRFSAINFSLLIPFLQITVTCYSLIHNYFPAPFSKTLNPTLQPRVTVYIILHLITIFKPTHKPSILFGYIPTIHQIFFRPLFGLSSNNPLDNDVCVLWEKVVCFFFF